MPKPVWFDWLTVAAIVIGPVLALLTQRALDRLREHKNRRVQLYLTLMSTRAVGLSPAHVQALNSIDTVFGGRGDQKIRDAWQKVLEHLATDPATERWGERLLDLKTDLYQAIGSAVGYNYGIDYLKTRVYAPRAYVDMEQEQIHIRQMLGRCLSERGLKVDLGELRPEAPPALRPPR